MVNKNIWDECLSCGKNNIIKLDDSLKCLSCEAEFVEWEKC